MSVPAPPISRRFALRLLLLLLVTATGVTGQSACACNIPVFRYALERWSSDDLQLHLVVHDSQLHDADRRVIDELTGDNGSTTNLTATVWDLDSKLDLPAFLDEWSLPASNEPWCLIRSVAGAEPARTVWSSPLREIKPALIRTSPARESLAKMLLQGDSAVWIVIRGHDDEQADAVIQLLTTTLRKLEDETQLPDGIGLPGSELYSEVPLMVSFPILEIDANDPTERVFLEHVRAFLPRSQSASTTRNPTLVVPVFGRGRALVALRADDINPETVADLTTFLSGACSCQVKRMNPGFDLLLSVNWKRQLFGDNASDVPVDELKSDEDSGIPTLVAIAPGNAETNLIPPLLVVSRHSDNEQDTANEVTSGRREESLASDGQESTRNFVWLTGGFAGLVALGTIIPALRRPEQS
jgi:hypothetical protein